jgi:hypothetical protein
MNMHATIEEPISKQRIGKHTTIEVLLETVLSVGAAPRLYNEDLRQLRGELRESLETAVEYDGEKRRSVSYSGL